MESHLVPQRTPLDSLGKDADRVLSKIATDLGELLKVIAEREGHTASARHETLPNAEEEAPTLAQMILQAADVEGKLSTGGAYLLEAAYAIADKEPQLGGLLTSECLFLAALEWGRRTPGAPSPPHALISLAEAVDAMNPEAIERLFDDVLPQETVGAS